MKKYLVPVLLMIATIFAGFVTIGIMATIVPAFIASLSLIFKCTCVILLLAITLWILGLVCSCIHEQN